jgi:UDP-N-acetylglucosamine 2-epimerase (non-hydrolysing)
VGDVNATIASSLVAVKMGIPVAHVEAGLRSGDRTMPEEINRIVTDAISDYLFVTEHSGLVNLAKENVPDEKVFFVGNVMIDSLVHFRAEASKSSILEDLGVSPKSYVLITTHRPANVDNKEGLEAILQIVKDAVALYGTVVFAIHPRTANNLQKMGLEHSFNQVEGLKLIPPQGYLEFLKLMDNAAVIVTDSGGIQEETTYLQVPCLTFRDTTERPVTVELGTNQLLADLNPSTVQQKMAEIAAGKAKRGIIPPFWDGKAAERIADILVRKFNVGV